MDKERHQAAADWATTWLSRAFPGSFPDEGSTAERNKLLLALLDEHPWIEPKSWEVGIKAVCWQHMGDYMPPPAKIIEAIRADQDERRRKTESAQVLPPPTSTATSRFPREKWNYNYAIGSLRVRGNVKEPTEQEIQDRMAELIASGSLLPPHTAPLVHLKDMVRIAWRDGTVTETKMLDEEHARVAHRWAQTHNPGQEN